MKKDLRNLRKFVLTHSQNDSSSGKQKNTGQDMVLTTHWNLKLDKDTSTFIDDSESSFKARFFAGNEQTYKKFKVSNTQYVGARH